MQPVVTEPERLRRRPHYGHYPIPFVSQVTDGVPDFRVNDEDKRLQCIGERLCELCGESLDYWIFFIGGPKCLEHHLFLDPAMHEECARYALATCPYLATPGRGYSDREKHATFEYGVVSDRRPTAHILYRTRTYSPTQRQGQVLIYAAPPKGIEWFHDADKSPEKTL